MQQNTNENKKSKKKKIIILSSVFSALALAGLGVGISFIPFKKTKNSDFDKGGAVIPKPPVVVEPPVIPDPILPIDPIEDPDANLVQKRDQSSNLIRKDQKVKYFAFGDSISAGFSGELPKDYPGEFKDGKVTGASFPSYLASFISKLSEGKLESFDNYSASGSTIVDWMELLGIQYDKNDADEVNYYATSVTDKLDYFVKNKFNGDKAKAKEEILKKIKESNLITITLGANDVIQLLIKLIMDTDISKIISEFMDKNTLSQETLLKEITPKVLKVMRVVRTLLQKRLATISKELKIINPKANIVFASYPLPMQRILLMINDILPASIKDIVSVDKILANLLTEKIKESAILHKNNFINLYDADYWKEHQEKLTPMILDIHPSIFGYKKMAIELFIKISAGVDLSYKVAKKYGITKNHFDNLSFSTKDQNDWILEMPTKTSDEAFEKIFGTNIDEFMFKAKDEIYDSVKEHINQEHFGKRMNDDATFGIVASLNTTIKNLFKHPKYLELDPNKYLATFFEKENGKNLALFQSWFQKSNFLTNAMNKIQKDIVSKDWDADGIVGTKKIKLEYLKQIITEIFDYNQIFTLIKELIGSDFATTNHYEFATTLSNFVSSLVKNPKVENLLERAIEKLFPAKYEVYVSKEDVKKLIVSVLKSDNLPKVLKNTVDAIFALKVKDETKFNQTKNFEELLKLIFNSEVNVFAELKQNLKGLIVDTINDDQNKSILVRLGLTFIKKTYPEILENVDDSKTKSVLNALLKSTASAIERYEFLPLVIQELFNEITTSGFSFNFANFGNNLKTKLLQYVKSLNYGEEIFRLGKELTKNEELKQNVASLKLILQNATKLGLKKLDAKSKIAKMLKDKTSEYLSDEEILKISSLTTNQKLIDALIDYLLDLGINNAEIYEQSQNIGELIEKLFAPTSSANLNAFVKKFMNVTFEQPETAQLLNSIATKFGLNKDFQNNEFVELIKGLIDFGLEKENEFNISNNFIKETLKSLLVSGSSLDIQTIIKQQLTDLGKPGNILNIIKSVLKDDALRTKADAIEKLLNNLLAAVSLKPEYKESISSLISKNSFNLVKNYLTEEQYKNIISALISNKDLHSLISKSVKNLLNLDKSAIEGVTTFNDLIKLIFSNTTIKADLENFTLKFAKSVLKDVAIQEALANILYDLANKNVPNVFANTEKSSVITILKSLIGNIKEIEDKINIITPLIQAVLNQLSSNGINVNQTTLFEEIKTKFFEKFQTIDVIQALTLKLVKLVTENADLKAEKSSIETILLNSVKFVDEKFGLQNKLKDLIGNKLDEYLDAGNIEKLVSIPFKDEIVQELIKFIVGILFERGSQYSSEATLEAMLTKLFEDSQNNLNTFVGNLLEKIINLGESKSVIKNLLVKQGLTTGIQDEDIDKVSSALVKLISQTIKKEDVLHKNVADLVKKLAQQGTSLNFNQELTTILKTIKETYTKEEKVVELIKFFVTNTELKKASEPLVKLLENAYDKYVQGTFKDKIVTFIKEKVTPLAQNAISAEQLEELAKILIKDASLKEFLLNTIKTTITKFEENDFTGVTTYNELIKKIFSKDSAKTQLKTDFKKVFNSLIGNEKVKITLSAILAKVLKEKLPTYFNGTQEEGLKKVFNGLLNIVPSLESSLNSIDLTSDLVFENLAQNGKEFNFAAFQESLVAKLKEKLENPNSAKVFVLTTLKAIAAQPELKAEVATIKTIANNAIKELMAKNNLKTIIVDKLKPILKDYIRENKIEGLVNAIASDQNISDILDFTLKALITNSDQFANVNDLKELVQKVLQNNNIYELIEKITKNILEVQDVKDEIIALMKKYNLNIDIDDAQLPELVKNLVLGIVDLDKDSDYNFLQKILEKTVNAFIDQGKAANIKVVIGEFKDEIIAKIFSQDEMVKLLKALISKSSFKKTSEHLSKLFRNILVFVNENKQLSETIYEKFPELGKKYIDKDNFKTIFKKLISEPNLLAFIDPFVKDLLEHNENYVSSNTFQDILKIFIEKNPSYNLKDKLKNLITSISNYEEVGKLISKAMIKLANEYEFDLSDAKFTKLFNDLAKDVPNILTNFGLIEKFANFVETNIKNLTPLDQIVGNLTSELSSWIDYKNYKNISGLLKLNFIQKNKTTIKDIFELFFGRLKAKPELVQKLLDKTQLSARFEDLPENGKKEFEDLFKVLLAADDIKNVVMAFIDQLIVHSDKYTNFAYLSQAIHNFLNSSESDKVETALKNIVKTTANNSRFLGIFVGNSLTESQKTKGIDLDAVEQIRPHFIRAVDTLLKGIAKTDLFDVILGNVFENIKTLQPNTKELPDYLADLKLRAIRGAMKFVSSGNDTIEITEIIKQFNQSGRAAKIFDTVDSESFAKVINFIFRHSSLEKKEGAYGAIFNKKLGTELDKYKDFVRHIDEDTKGAVVWLRSSRSYSSITRASSGKTEQPLNIKTNFNVAEIISIIRVFKPLINALYTPLAKEFWKSAKELNLNDLKTVKKTHAYQASLRLFTTLTAFITNNLFIWKIPLEWISGAIKDSFTNQLSKNNTLQFLNTKYNNNLIHLGVKQNEVIDLYFNGTDSPSYEESLKPDFFRNISYHQNNKTDWILYYAGFYDKTSSKNPFWNGKKTPNIIQLAKALKYGYLD